MDRVVELSSGFLMTNRRIDPVQAMSASPFFKKTKTDGTTGASAFFPDDRTPPSAGTFPEGVRLMAADLTGKPGCDGWGYDANRQRGRQCGKPDAGSRAGRLSQLDIIGISCFTETLVCRQGDPASTRWTGRMTAHDNLQLLMIIEPLPERRCSLYNSTVH